MAKVRINSKSYEVDSEEFKQIKEYTRRLNDDDKELKVKVINLIKKITQK